ncbi:hypothetical protein K431DRAFT_310238 [Polychaeton citri CBS 116435]|uniref:Nab2-like CCCH zinc finger domain-containing protein n=1 Tax=Polychaeton citri CBS 116435 TaxID=1314669 RepID=A0A9P4UQ96_9PEZI|nr:hypothetical protein K431DRAFT_310238 [Polychaeton citri CBS 116435]
MALIVEAGSDFAQAIQTAVQPKLVENGWAAEENDTTLAEYVTMMLVNNKDADGVRHELGGELLGIGEDDPNVGEFAQWLFGTILPQLNSQINGVGAAGADSSMQTEGADATQHTQQIQSLSDAQMDDAGSGPADGVPSGPKAMRNGPLRGRGGRLLGQVNRHMDRNADPNDSLRRIKGAASGGAGRIDAHSARAPRGPKNQSLQNGVNRMMNGRGGGAMGAGVVPPAMMGQQGSMPSLNQQQQMQFMQLMEQQAAMMSQIFGQNPAAGGFPAIPNGNSTRGGFKGTRGGRGGARGGFNNNQLQDNRDHIAGTSQDPNSGNAASMEVEMGESGVSARRDPFDTICKFNIKCTNPSCPFAHQSPAAPPGTTIDLTDRCSYNAACENKKCSAKHPSPAQRRQHLKDEVDCKFYPNCTNPACPFRHPDMPPCRNGADCTVANCKFVHSKIACRYNPCLNPQCMYKHGEGQKRGKFEDKVWTPGNGAPGSDANGGHPEGFDREAAMKREKSERFSGIEAQTANGEELIRPSLGENGNDRLPSPERGGGMDAEPSQQQDVVT